MLATPPTGLATEYTCLYFISADSVSKYKWRHPGNFQKAKKLIFQKRAIFALKMRIFQDVEGKSKIASVTPFVF